MSENKFSENMSQNYLYEPSTILFSMFYLQYGSTGAAEKFWPNSPIQQIQHYYIFLYIIFVLRTSSKLVCKHVFKSLKWIPEIFMKYFSSPIQHYTFFYLLSSDSSSVCSMYIRVEMSSEIFLADFFLPDQHCTFHLTLIVTYIICII